MITIEIGNADLDSRLARAEQRKDCRRLLGELVDLIRSGGTVEIVYTDGMLHERECGREL